MPVFPEELSVSLNFDHFLQLKHEKESCEKYKISLKELASNLNDVLLEKVGARSLFLRKLNIDSKVCFQAEIFSTNSILSDIYEVFIDEFSPVLKTSIISKFYPSIY